MPADKNYQKVLAAIPSWKPTRQAKRFSVTAIMEILNGESDIPCIGFLDSYDILKRLQIERKIPEGWE